MCAPSDADRNKREREIERSAQPFFFSKIRSANSVQLKGGPEIRVIRSKRNLSGARGAGTRGTYSITVGNFEGSR